MDRRNRVLGSYVPRPVLPWVRASESGTMLNAGWALWGFRPPLRLPLTTPEPYVFLRSASDRRALPSMPPRPLLREVGGWGRGFRFYLGRRETKCAQHEAAP